MWASASAQQQHTPQNGLRQSVQTVSVSIGRDIAGKVKVSPACECQCERGHVGCGKWKMGRAMRGRVRIKLKRIFSLVENTLRNDVLKEGWARKTRLK